MEDKPEPVKDLQKEQLFEKGINSEGKKLRKYRSAAYARKKNQMNPAPGLGNPDFNLTGEFQREIYLEIQGNKLKLESTNEKTALLVKRDGEEIFGLTNDSVLKYRPVLLPEIVKRIKSKTGAK